MHLRNRRSACSRVASLALAASVASMTACLVIPVDYHAAGSRRNVSAETSESLQPGVTSKQEVLLTLGEPDFASEDSQRLGYAWKKVKAIWFVASYSQAAAGEIERSYVLEIAFDASNRVSRARLLKGWGPEVPPDRELEVPSTAVR